MHRPRVSVSRSLAIWHLNECIPFVLVPLYFLWTQNTFRVRCFAAAAILRARWNQTVTCQSTSASSYTVSKRSWTFTRGRGIWPGDNTVHYIILLHVFKYIQRRHRHDIFSFVVCLFVSFLFFCISSVLVFPPLPSRLRYLIHNHVEDLPDLCTFSVGESSCRRVVVCHSELRCATGFTHNVSANVCVCVVFF